jgi:hypothetical protein
MAQPQRLRHGFKQTTSGAAKLNYLTTNLQRANSQICSTLHSLYDSESIENWPVRVNECSGDVSTTTFVIPSAFTSVGQSADPAIEINAGLLGPIIVTAKGKANPDGSPKDVDREFVASFMIFNEMGGKPAGLFYAINGFIFGNLPGLNYEARRESALVFAGKWETRLTFILRTGTAKPSPKEAGTPM